jgi:phage shock protein A
MASLMKSIGNFFRGKRDEAAQAMADPVRDGKFAIEDSKKQIASFQQQIAKLIAETKKLERQRDDAKAESTKYQKMAEKAAAQGNEEHVRKLLEEKKREADKFASYKDQVVKNEQLTEKLRTQLNKARGKVADAESNVARLSARKEAAEIRQDMAKAQSEFNADGNALSALDDLEKVVNQEEAEAEAWEELVGDENATEELEDLYGGSASAVDDDVAKLMAAAAKKNK